MSGLGIDFGTSTTLAAIGQGPAAEAGGVSPTPIVVRLPSGDEIVPSFVAFAPDGQVLVGRDARGRRVIDPANTLHAFKRILGRPWLAAEVRAFGRSYPFQLSCGADNLPRFTTRAGQVTAAEVATYLLAYLREAPQVAAHPAVTMTVPVTARAEQRAALVSAALGAGFQRVGLVDEPCAAALAALKDDPREQVTVVYDLGGGTFDCTVLHWQPPRYRVLALAGDSYLGGDDITLRLAIWVAERILETHHWNVRTNISSWQRLLLACDQLKAALSMHPSQTLNLGLIDEVLVGHSLTVPRAELERLCMDLVQRTFLICDEALRQAGRNVHRVQSLVLSGGCCHMPLIQQSVRSYFGKEPRLQLSPDRLVALGAAAIASGAAAIPMGSPSH